MSNRIKNILTRDNFKKYIHEIKNYFTLALLIFIVSLFVGAICTQLGLLDSLMSGMVNDVADTPITYTSITFNNITVGLMIMAFGFLFSIFSVIMLFINGLLIGYIVELMPILLSIAYIVPHGIFEIPALLLAVFVSFMITHLECKLINALLHRRLKEEIKQSKKLVKIIIITVILSIILFLIAGYIEVYLTEPIGNYLLDLLI